MNMVYLCHTVIAERPPLRARSTKEAFTMKFLKALLAVLTTLAVAFTAALLLWQDKNAPRYIHIYDNEQ